MSKSGSKIREQVAHFLVDIHSNHQAQLSNALKEARRLSSRK